MLITAAILVPFMSIYAVLAADDHAVDMRSGAVGLAVRARRGRVLSQRARRLMFVKG